MVYYCNTVCFWQRLVFRFSFQQHTWQSPGQKLLETPNFVSYCLPIFWHNLDCALSNVRVRGTVDCRPNALCWGPLQWLTAELRWIQACIWGENKGCVLGPPESSQSVRTNTCRQLEATLRPETYCFQSVKPRNYRHTNPFQMSATCLKKMSRKSNDITWGLLKFKTCLVLLSVDCLKEFSEKMAEEIEFKKQWCNWKWLESWPRSIALFHVSSWLIFSN